MQCIIFNEGPAQSTNHCVALHNSSKIPQTLKKVQKSIEQDILGYRFKYKLHSMLVDPKINQYLIIVLLQIIVLL